MSTAFAVARAQRRLQTPTIAGLGVAFAALCGAATTVDVKLALGLVAAVAIAFAIAYDARFLPPLLAATIFVESVQAGGLRVGRIAAPLALAIVVTYLLVRGRAGLRTNPLLAAILAYGLWLATSYFWAASPAAVVKTLGGYGLAVAYMLAFALLVRTPRQLSQLALVFAAGVLVFGIYGVYQHQTRTGLDGPRAYGLQGDANFYAVYQAIALPLVLVLAARARPARRPLLYCVLAVIPLSIAASLSRTGMLAFGLLALATLLLPWRLFFRQPGAKRVYATLLVASVGLAVVVGSTTLLNRAESIYSGAPANDRSSGRTDIWRAAERAAREHPWLGLGAGNFAAQSLGYLQTTPGVADMTIERGRDRPVHNAYLEQVTDLGPVGLALYLSILWLTIKTYLVAFRRARAAGSRILEQYSAALLLSFSALTLAAFFLSSQLLKPPWMLIGLALALEVMTRRLEPR